MNDPLFRGAGDAQSTMHPDGSRLGDCCGGSEVDGPNLVGEACETELATRQADCYGQKQVTPQSDAVILSYIHD